MLATETLLTFTIASVLLALAPGPDNVFVMTESAVNGRRSGLLVTLGLCTGLMVHTLAVAVGVAAIFQVSTVAFTGLKLVGAGYLIYLAWLSWRAAAASLQSNSEPLSNAALYRRGIIMNVTNPKVAIFFLAFLPQFTDPIIGGITPQIITLGFVFMLTTWVVFSSIAMLSAMLKTWLTEKPNSQPLLNKVAATVFVALAIKLLLTQQSI